MLKKIFYLILLASFTILPQQVDTLNYTKNQINQYLEKASRIETIIGDSLQVLRQVMNQSGGGYTVDPVNNLNYTLGINKITLTWNYPATGSDSVIIYRADNQIGGLFTKIATISYSANTYIDTPLTSNIAYDYYLVNYKYSQPSSPTYLYGLSPYNPSERFFFTLSTDKLDFTEATQLADIIANGETGDLSQVDSLHYGNGTIEVANDIVGEGSYSYKITKNWGDGTYLFFPVSWQDSLSIRFKFYLPNNYPGYDSLFLSPWALATVTRLYGDFVNLDLRVNNTTRYFYRHTGILIFPNYNIEKNTWNTIELQHKYSSTTGMVKVIINYDTVLSQTDINFMPPYPIQGIKVGVNTTSWNNSSVYIDDIKIVHGTKFEFKETEKILVIKNDSTISSYAKITVSAPFQVDRDSVMIAAGDTAHIKVSYQTTNYSGLYQSDLVINNIRNTQIIPLKVIIGNITPPGVVKADYYFDAVNGSNANSGKSPDQAWKTASKFNSATFPPGSIIAFRDSMEYKGYFEITESGTAQLPIIITNWYDTLSRKLPFIEGGSTQNITNASWTEYSTNIWRTTLSGFTGLWFVYPDSTVWGIREQTLDSLNEEFEAYWESPYLYIYSPQNPSIRYSKILTDYGDGQSLSASCFTISGKYIHIKNLEMGYTHGKALKFMWGSDYSKATNIIAKFNGTSHIKGIAGEGGDAIYISASNITIEKCTTYETSGHGYYVWGNSSGTVENVIIDNCVGYNNHHTVGVDINSQTGKIRNVHIRNSFFYTTVATYWRNYETFNNGNLSMGNFVKGEITGAGLVKYVYFYNNVFKHITGPSIQTESKADSIFIYNNIFIETDSAVSPIVTAIRNWCIYGTSETPGGLILKNNIFYATSPVSNNYVVRAYNNAVMSNNLAYRLDGSSYLIYPNDPNYQAPIVADPQFLNHSHYSLNPLDYRLQSTSPAINAGTNLGSPFNYDRLGIPRPSGTAWDIGAFEYVFQN